MSAAQTAAFLRRAADAIEAGRVPEPHIDVQFVIAAEPDQGAALTAAGALLPGGAWQSRIVHHRALGPAAHIDGRDGRVHVTVSGAADRLPATAVYELTGEHQRPESGAAA